MSKENFYRIKLHLAGVDIIELVFFLKLKNNMHLF